MKEIIPRTWDEEVRLEHLLIFFFLGNCIELHLVHSQVHLCLLDMMEINPPQKEISATLPLRKISSLLPFDWEVLDDIMEKLNLNLALFDLHRTTHPETTVANTLVLDYIVAYLGKNCFQYLCAALSSLCVDTALADEKFLPPKKILFRTSVGVIAVGT